jgi:hypothetical protein
MAIINCISVSATRGAGLKPNSTPVDSLHPRWRNKVAPMSVKEVPSDHDFFDPAYVKHWSDSIIRYRPERKKVFKAFAAEAARMKKTALSSSSVAALDFWPKRCWKIVISGATRWPTSRRRCSTSAGNAWRSSKTRLFLFN